MAILNATVKLLGSVKNLIPFHKSPRQVKQLIVSCKNYSTVGKKRFEIRQMVNDDVEEVSRLLSSIMEEKDIFYKFLNFKAADLYRIWKPVIEEHVPEKLSFVCVDNSLAAIVAIQLCGKLKLYEIKQEDHFNAQTGLEMLDNQISKRYLKLHEHEDCGDLFNLYFTAVKTGYEKKGFAIKLAKVSYNAAKTMGFKYGLTNTMSPATEHIMQVVLGMKRAFSVRLDDVEYKGVKFLKGITEVKEYSSFDINFDKWDLSKNSVEMHFD